MESKIWQKYDYLVYDEETMRVLYTGNQVLKAIEANYLNSHTKIQFSGQIQEAVFNHLVALQERLN